MTCSNCANMHTSPEVYAKISAALFGLNRKRRAKTAAILAPLGDLKALGVCLERPDTVVGPNSAVCDKFKEKA